MPSRVFNLPISLSGFEHINRYWDPRNKFYAAKITPGQYYVTVNSETIVTVLGSCISACIRDTKSGVGGMNHFMLPVSRDGTSHWHASDPHSVTRYGNNAMEHMINDILTHGGQRRNLEVKICGGGAVLKNMTLLDIGTKNIDFVKDYISTDNLKLISEDVGGIFPRKVQYSPETGQLRVKKLRSRHNDTIINRETEYQHQIEGTPVAGEIELF